MIGSETVNTPRRCPATAAHAKIAVVFVGVCARDHSGSRAHQPYSAARLVGRERVMKRFAIFLGVVAISIFAITWLAPSAPASDKRPIAQVNVQALLQNAHE